MHLKFLLTGTTTIAILLAAYQLGVRYTVIGTTLNGPRTPLLAPARAASGGAIIPTLSRLSPAASSPP